HRADRPERDRAAQPGLRADAPADLRAGADPCGAVPAEGAGKPGAEGAGTAPACRRPATGGDEMSPPLLEVDRLVMRFGGLTAVQGLSFAVEHGTIHGLIGPNGAG